MGCAASSKGRAAQLVVVSDAAADELAAGWEKFATAQIEYCKETLVDDATEGQRSKCVGIAAKGEALEAAVQSLIAVQTIIKEATKCEELKTCVEEVDWKTLKTEIFNAWIELKPFYEAIGANQ